MSTRACKARSFLQVSGLSAARRSPGAVSATKATVTAMQTSSPEVLGRMLPDSGDVVLQLAHDAVQDLVEHLVLLAQRQRAQLLHRGEFFHRGDQDAHAAAVDEHQ